MNRAQNASAVPAERFARCLAAGLSAGKGGTLTWLNHYTALQTMRARIPLEEFDFLGIDGLLLRRLISSPVPRTSADLVLPLLLRASPPLRIALFGGRPEVLDRVADKLEEGYGHCVLIKRDGYEGLPDAAQVVDTLRAASIQLVIVGLGAPRQDHYALALRDPHMLVATCGGWFDQFIQVDYYPRWTYRLRLNWLVRLWREPRRLWRRYTVDALTALFLRTELAAFVSGSGRRPLATMKRSTE